MDDTRHGLEDGDYVTFSEIQGMVELNNIEPQKVKVLGPYTFTISDTTKYSEYIRGGIATQVKMPKSVQFKPLKESMKNPEFLMTDYGKFDFPEQLHLAYQTLHKFIEKNQRKPKPWNKSDAVEFLAIAKALKADEGSETEINTELLEIFAKVCSGQLNGMNATIGGIVAQEVMKACSGKFFPIYQWLYFDAIECLPKGVELSEEDCAPTGSRYDGQIAVFGKKFQEKLGKYKRHIMQPKQSWLDSRFINKSTYLIKFTHH